MIRKKFELDEEEWKKADSFIKDHDCHFIKKRIHLMTGPGVDYLFSTDSIGTSIVVSCGCGKKIDVTDYEMM